MTSILSDKIEKKNKIFSSRVPITTGKGNSCSTRPSKAKPFGFVEKIILARRACGIFFPKPCMYGTRPFKACSYGNSGPEMPD